MVLGILAIGIAVGLIMGALGGGGSVLTVPILVFVFGLTAQQGTAGSLVIVGVAAAIASVGHARSGHTDVRKALTISAVGVPTSLAGTVLNHRCDQRLLLAAFAALLLVAAASILRPRAAAPEAPLPDGGGGVATLTRVTTTTDLAVRTVLVGLGIGFLTGFLGVGGGFVIVPALVLGLDLEMPVAVGTSLLVIALNSAVALALRAGHASYAWHIVVPFTLAAVAGSLAGKRVTDRVDAHALSRAFGVLLVLVAAYVTVKAATGGA